MTTQCLPYNGNAPVHLCKVSAPGRIMLYTHHNLNLLNIFYNLYI